MVVSSRRVLPKNLWRSRKLVTEMSVALAQILLSVEN